MTSDFFQHHLMLVALCLHMFFADEMVMVEGIWLSHRLPPSTPAKLLRTFAPLVSLFALVMRDMTFAFIVNMLLALWIGVTLTFTSVKRCDSFSFQRYVAGLVACLFAIWALHWQWVCHCSWVRGTVQ